MRDVLIICTKDRPNELRRCLESVSTQTIRPTLTIVVDASADDASSQVSSSFGGTIYVNSEPGLTRQRNLAVELYSSEMDVLHFVDDDVVLDPGYIAGLRQAFTDPKVGGAGGVIANAPPARPYLVRRLFLLDSRKPGKVLPSGCGILAFDPPHSLIVDWLSGCSMSFRADLFNRIRFDEGLTGYCLGEDVDFGLAASALTNLVVTPAARLVHLSSPINRLDSEKWATLDVLTRHRRVARNGGRLE